MRSGIFAGFLLGQYSLVASSISLLSDLKEGVNVLSPVTAYYIAEANNVARCKRMCQYEKFCFLATYSQLKRKCYLYDKRSIEAEVITAPGWILFNNTLGRGPNAEECVRNEICRSEDTTFEKPDKSLTVKVDTDLKATDCYDVREQGGLASGVYTVFPRGGHTGLSVFCDQETDGGDWLVFQRRMDGSEDFYRGWKDYENGFGNLKGEFWLGNRYISDISTHGQYELRVDLEDFKNNKAFAVYKIFSVGDASTGYRLTVGAYTGTAGDSLDYHNGQTFKTNEKADGECAVRYNGGFWYNQCHQVNVNGLYRKGKFSGDPTGVSWLDWKGHNYSLKMTELKIRPTVYTSRYGTPSV